MADPQKIMLGTASCEDLMQCMLNLGDLEIKILRKIMDSGPMKNEDLARQFKRDKSIIHRCLQRLMTCGLVVREKLNISKGGYYYVYSTIPEDAIRDKMSDCVENMYRNMKRLVDDFELKGRKRKGSKR